MGEYRTTPGEPPPLPKRERNARIRRGILTALLVLAALAATGYHMRLPRTIPATGMVVSREHAEVRTSVPARVEEIHARSGHLASRNELLAQLEDATERAQWAAAKRLAEKAEAELALRKAEVMEQRRQHSFHLETARRKLEHQRERLELTKQLFDQGLASGRDLSDHLHAIQLSEIEFRLLEETDPLVDTHRITVLEREIAVRGEAVVQAHAAVQARAIRAPIDGKVLRYPFHVGEVVRPEHILYEVFGGDGLILRLRVPERYAARVEPGQPCRVKLRSFPSLRPRWFYGEIIEMRDAIETEGHQAYRVVYASFETGEATIQPGANADARIRIGRAPLGTILLGL